MLANLDYKYALYETDLPLTIYCFIGYYYGTYTIKNGLLIQSKRYRESGDLVRQQRYSYDSLGNMIENNSFDAYDKYTRGSKFQYNKFGLLTKEESYYPTPTKMSSMTILFYDDRKLLVKEAHYSNIENNDYRTGKYSEYIYKYSFRK